MLVPVSLGASTKPNQSASAPEYCEGLAVATS